MTAIVDIRSGPHADQRATLQTGQVLRVGRDNAANLVLRHDPMLSNVHFALDWDGRTCRLRDLGSRFGTQVNNVKVTEAALKDGDEISAGRTTFVLRLPAVAAAAEATPPPTVPSASPQPSLPTLAAEPAPPVRAIAHDHVLQVLRAQQEPFFALLDAARSPRVREVLRGAQVEYQSLYEGSKGQELADCAPYLVRLPQAPLLETLVREGWGASWAVYLCCGQPLAEVRRHLRRFLLVKTEDGRELYFRFYDPRVLRVYLPTCRSEEARQFFGPIRSYLLEGEQGETLLRFRAGSYQVEQESVPLVSARPR
jgi:hypothetical protein